MLSGFFFIIVAPAPVSTDQSALLVLFYNTASLRSQVNGSCEDISFFSKGKPVRDEQKEQTEQKA